VRRRLIALAIVFLVAWGGLATLTALGVTPKLGLDLEGGTSVVLTAPPDTEQDVLELAVGIMRSRIEEVGGVQEPEIAISGSNTVLVQLPGVEDERRALDAIGQTGQLTFRPVIGSYAGEIGPYGSSWQPPTADVQPPEGTPPPNLDPVTGISTVDDPDQEVFLVYTSDFGGSEVLHLGPARLVGSDVAQAVPGFDTTRSQWVVSLDLTSDGGDKFAQLTGEAARAPVGSPQRQIAIVLDADVIAAPAVNPDVQAGVGIAGGRAQITLGNSQNAESEARDLAIVLRYGSLPVSFEQSQVSKVSATLGTDSLRIGLIAGLAGLLLVAIVLVAYYRSLGVVAVVGLTVFGSTLVSLFSLLGKYQGLTLTLAGVTGIIVSVGITADSYIVYFERIKDEIRSGQTVASAVTDGFKGAFRTILTGDTVSLLGAGLLWLLAVGPVKGFALSLGLATILDVFIARLYTRRAVWAIAHTRLGDGGAFSIAGAAGPTAETREVTA
jgi:protein-export membrane protein SecD